MANTLLKAGIGIVLGSAGLKLRLGIVLGATAAVGLAWMFFGAERLSFGRAGGSGPE